MRGPVGVFRCPSCRAPLAVEAGAEPRCQRCGAGYGLHEGIPLLVADWAKHEARLEAARRDNPGWYVDAQAPEETSPWRHHLRKRRRYVEGVLRREQARRGARIPRLLDLGCGDGSHLPWLGAFAETLYGCDFNLVRLDRARRRCPEARLFLCDMLDPPLEDAVFDVVFFNHVIEHIEDDQTALATVYRILRSDGLLVLGTPNEGCWWWQLAYRRDPDSRANTDHVHFYTADSIGEKVRRAGFELVETHHMGWGPPDWHWDARLRRHKLLDDSFEWVGRALLPRQASSLYLLARRRSAA
jgi:SAM-dependent methyltransferase